MTVSEETILIKSRERSVKRKKGGWEKVRRKKLETFASGKNQYWHLGTPEGIMLSPHKIIIDL